MDSTIAVETITQIMKENNTSQSITLAVILIIFLVISKVIDSRTKRNQIVLSDKLVGLIEMLSVQFKRQESSDREKCRMTIEFSFESFSKNLFDFARIIIINNDVELKRKYIEPSIETTVNAEYYKVFNALYIFEVNSHRVSNFMKEDWRAEIIASMNLIIFDKDLDTINKLTTLHSKLDSKISDYSTYIHNRTFNE